MLTVGKDVILSNFNEEESVIDRIKIIDLYSQFKNNNSVQCIGNKTDESGFYNYNYIEDMKLNKKTLPILELVVDGVKTICGYNTEILLCDNTYIAAKYICPETLVYTIHGPKQIEGVYFISTPTPTFNIGFDIKSSENIVINNVILKIPS